MYHPYTYTVEAMKKDPDANRYAKKMGRPAMITAHLFEKHIKELVALKKSVELEGHVFLQYLRLGHSNVVQVEQIQLLTSFLESRGITMQKMLESLKADQLVVTIHDKPGECWLYMTPEELCAEGIRGGYYQQALSQDTTDRLHRSIKRVQGDCIEACNTRAYIQVRGIRWERWWTPSFSAITAGSSVAITAGGS